MVLALHRIRRLAYIRTLPNKACSSVVVLEEWGHEGEVGKAVWKEGGGVGAAKAINKFGLFLAS